MKTPKLILMFSAAALLNLGLPHEKAAALPFYETFNSYPQGTIAGNKNAEGNSWTPMGTNLANDVIVTNLTLDYPGLECNGTNSIIFGGNVGYTERVGIGPTNGTTTFAAVAGTIYYSFVFQVNNLAGLTAGGGFATAFTTVTGPSTNQPSVGGAPLYFRLNSGGESFDLGVGKNQLSPNAATFAGTNLTVGTTNFVVVAYTFVPGSNTNDYASLWVNPDPSTFGAAVPPVATVTNSNTNTDIQVGGANQIESFYFREANTVIPVIQASNLRIAHCWGCVTPPTNPPALVRATLSIALSGSNSLVTSWGTNAPCAVLQTTTNGLPTTNWSQAPALTTVGVSTNGFVLTNNAAINSNTPSRFYRLQSLVN